MLISAIVFCFSFTVSAEEKKTEALFDLSLEELLNTDVSVATKSKLSSQEAPSIVSVITANEIRNMGARNIIDILRTVPGFDITQAATFSRHQTDMRGIRNSTVMNKFNILINGHALNADFGGASFTFDRIPVASIRQIEIIRGPGSALYGAGAFLGVINIITKEGGDEPSQMSLEYGSYDTLRPSAELSYKKNDFKAYLYADYYRTDGFDGLIESDSATGKSYLVSNAPGKMNSDSTYHTAETLISFKDFYFSGFLCKSDSVYPLGPAKALVQDSDIDELYGYGEFGYKSAIGDRGDLLIRAYYDYTDWKSTADLFSEKSVQLPIHKGFPLGEAPMSGYFNKQSVTGYEITADYEFYPGVRITAGNSYEHSKVYDVRAIANYNATGHNMVIGGITYPSFPYIYFPGGMTDVSDIANWLKGDEYRDVTALYGQSVLDFKKIFSLEKGVKNLSLTAGIRYDHYTDVGESVNPRAGLVYAPTESLYFKVLYGRAFRAPSFSELYVRNNPAGTGNESLNSETISTVEGLIGYNFTKNIRSSITFFNIVSKDLIQFKDKLYQNVGQIESDGMEAELKILFDKQKYAYLNVTWQDVKDTSHQSIVSKGGQVYKQDDFFPGSTAEFYGNIGINYDICEKVIGNLWINYVGEKDRSEEKIWNGETLVLKDARDPVKAHTLLNATLTFKNFIKGVEFQISGFNILDEDYRDPDAEGTLYYDMPQPGRTFMGKVSYSF
jgi:iron complex outermembrane receptor protein